VGVTALIKVSDSIGTAEKVRQSKTHRSLNQTISTHSKGIAKEPGNTHLLQSANACHGLARNRMPESKRKQAKA